MVVYVVLLVVMMCGFDLYFGVVDCFDACGVDCGDCWATQALYVLYLFSGKLLFCCLLFIAIVVLAAWGGRCCLLFFYFSLRLVEFVVMCMVLV